MVIKDSTEPNHWNDDQISYVDSYGSETYKNDVNKGCPFTMCQLKKNSKSVKKSLYVYSTYGQG